LCAHFPQQYIFYDINYMTELSVAEPFTLVRGL
jgi:hypothetical protein